VAQNAAQSVGRVRDRWIHQRRADIRRVDGIVLGSSSRYSRSSRRDKSSTDLRIEIKTHPLKILIGAGGVSLNETHPDENVAARVSIGDDDVVPSSRDMLRLLGSVDLQMEESLQTGEYCRPHFLLGSGGPHHRRSGVDAEVDELLAQGKFANAKAVFEPEEKPWNTPAYAFAFRCCNIF
jgi:hypothetical protein